jgi:tetratricopeptide (TPR) repeat protein
MRRRLASRRAVTWVAVFALALGACSSPQEKAKAYLEKGAAYAKEGKTKEALLEYRSALKLDPKSAEVNYRLAKILSAQGKYGDALFYLRETQRLDESRSDAALDEAKLLYTEDPKRSEALVKSVMEREPANPRAQLVRMELALHQSNTQEALAAAMTGLELAPKDPLYHLQLGLVQEARILEARSQGKEPPEALYQAALDAFQKADELYGGNSVARIHIGRTYVRWPAKRDQAAAVLRSAIEVANQKGDLKDRQDAAASGIAAANLLNDQELGLYALEQLIATDEANLDNWSRLASLRQAKDGAGEKVFRELIEKRPEDMDAQWRFTIWLFANGRGEDAIANLKALAGTSKSRARALDMLHALQLQMNQTDAAKETLAALEKEFPGDASTQLASARAATIESRYAEAAPLLRALSGKQETPEGMRLLAVCEYHLGNYPAALAAVDRSLALAGKNAVEPMLLKARIHAASRDWPLTIQTYDQILKLGLDVPARDLVVAASAFYDSNQPLAGRQLLERVLASPEPPLIAAAEFAAREGDKSPVEAKKHLDAALARAPKNPALILAITRVDLQAGREKEALARLNDLIEGGGAPPAALLARARLLAGTKQLEAAEKDMNRVFEAAPNLPGALELLVQIYAAQGKLDQATKSFEEADRAGALSPGARLLLGRLYLNSGDDVRARAMFERALTERADLSGAKNDLAFLLARNGVELDRALGLAQEAQQDMANDPNIADTLGFVYFKKGLSEPALQQSRYAIQLAEEAGQPQAVFQYHLGLVLRALGRNAEAAEAFERALAIDRNFADAGAAQKELEAARAEAKATPSSS